MHILVPARVSASNLLFKKPAKRRDKENTHICVPPVVAFVDTIDEEYKER